MTNMRSSHSRPDADYGTRGSAARTENRSSSAAIRFNRWKSASPGPIRMRRSQTPRARSIASSIDGPNPRISTLRRPSRWKVGPAWNSSRPGNPQQLPSALERIVDGALGIPLNLPQVALAAETLRIDLVDILGARRPRREPAVVGHNLDAAEGLAVAGRRRERGANRLAGKLLHGELVRRN